MNIAELQKLGLSHTEAKLYLVLLRVGFSDVQRLIEETGFYKSNTYDALERLYDKGIISKIIEGNKRVYQIQKPDSLVDFIEKKRSEIDEQEKLAKELSKQVVVSKKTNQIETAVVFRGISGVKQIYSEIINEITETTSKEYSDKNYSDFKNDLAEVVVGFIKPFQQKRKEFEKDPKLVMQILEQSEEKAQDLAEKTMEEVRRKIGLY